MALIVDDVADDKKFFQRKFGYMASVVDDVADDKRFFQRKFGYMASVVDDVADDERFFQRKFGYMASVVDDVADDERFFKRNFGTIENHGRSENLSIGFLMKKQKICDVNCADADYVMFLNGDISIPYDPPHELSVEDDGDISIPYDPPHELSVEDDGDISIPYDPPHELSVEDDVDDPDYGLFLSRLKKDGSSYILEADESIGLTKPLKYEEDESNDVGEDLNSPSRTQWRESVDDKDYAFFSDNLRLNGSNVIFQHDNVLPVVYDSEGPSNFLIGNGENSRNQMSMLSLHKEKSSYSSEEGSHNQSGKRKRKMCSKFRVQIMRILGKPYDKEEHRKLLRDITLQKAQLKHIDLRSGSVRFIKSEKIGKSYLEYHGDLKRKVKAAAKDDCKQLNLLRGFFFWLQNLTQEGSFIPWNDEECLAVRPEAC